jgi:Transposase DDE domain
LHGAEASAGGNLMVSSQYGSVLSPSTIPGVFVVPFKFNANRRHNIPRQPRRVTNWSEYDGCSAPARQPYGMVQRGGDRRLEGRRPDHTRRSAPVFRAGDILTALSLRAVFRLALRQTEGLIGSVIGLLDLDLAVPDHTTLCRRADGLDVAVRHG